MKLLVRNNGTEPLQGFRVVVGIGQRILTRSALQAFYEGVPVVSSSALPFDRTSTIAPGGTSRLTIEEPTDSFATLVGAVEGGVFPATLTLQTTEGVELETLHVPLIYYPEPPEVPIDIVTLLPLNDRPARAPNGSYRVDENGVPLQNALAEGGWLSGLLDALDTYTAPVEDVPAGGRGKRARRTPPRPLHVSVALSPLLLDDLRAMTDGFVTASEERVGRNEPGPRAAEATIERLSRLLQRTTIQRSLLPYAFPDIPTVVGKLPVSHLLAQLKAARDTLEAELGISGAGEWLFPPAGRLDGPSLERLRLVDPSGGNVFISHDSLDGSGTENGGCPDPSPSFTCLITLETSEGSVDAFASDPGLSARLSRLQTSGNDRATLQRFFAETAMIHAELPGTPNRVIQTTIPSLWHPPPRMARTLLKGLRDAPWLASLTASEAADSAEREAGEVVAEAPSLATEPEESFFVAAQEASEAIDAYAGVAPPDSPRLARLRKNILIAQNRTQWREPLTAAAFVNASLREVESEIAKIGLEGAQDFTCTSQECQLQLVVTNETTYPVTVTLRLVSPNLEVSSTDIEDTYEPGTQPLTVQARARGSGVFRLAARLTNGDGSFVIEEKTIVIRSTNFNRVALIVTLGALGFLIAFYAIRFVRRSRQRSDG